MSRGSEPTSALYVRLPAGEATKLDRAAEALGMRKKDLIAGLVSRYVDPERLEDLGDLGAPRRVTVEVGENPMQVGHYAFHQYEPAEVLTAAQAAGLLQIGEDAVVRLAEAGELPGRSLEGEWRFSRTALVNWLSLPR